MPRHCIKTALKNGVQPRCEIDKASDAQYYMDLIVKYFCLGDQIKVLRDFWTTQGNELKNLIK